MKKQIAAGAAALVAGGVIAYLARSKKPSKCKPVTDFELERYLGKWYEVARFDYQFEKNMTDTTAVYSLNKDGSVKVVNTGFDTKKKKWKSAEGKAKLRGSRHQGALKVSFFGPFYAGYNIMSVDPEYRYALVAGRNLDYLWILSRSISIPEDIREEFLTKARETGYDLSRLIWITHTQSMPPQEL